MICVRFVRELIFFFFSFLLLLLWVNKKASIPRLWICFKILAKQSIYHNVMELICMMCIHSFCVCTYFDGEFFFLFLFIQFCLAIDEIHAIQFLQNAFPILFMFCLDLNHFNTLTLNLSLAVFKK